MSREPDSKGLEPNQENGSRGSQKNDGTFDLLLNGKLDRNNIPETWLPEQLCVRFGFCGEEYDSILREVNQNGRTTIVF
jgi:hypothetical protein